MEVLFRGKTGQRLIDQLPTPLDGSVRIPFWSIFASFSFTQESCLAKSLVAAGLARRCLVQLSYAIGVAKPLSIFVETYGTGKKTDEELIQIIDNNFDLKPGVIGE